MPTASQPSVDLAFALHSQADAHYAAGRYDEALKGFLGAAKLNPASPVLPFNAGNTLRVLGRFEEAMACYDQAIALQPDFAIAHHNKAFCRLLLGDFAAGFRDYEWRKACPTFDDPRYGLGRAWTGQSLRGRSLLIYPELFQGDLIQFCRYAVLAERRGASVRLAAPRAMHALLRTLSPTIRLAPEDAPPARGEFHCALMSLPHLLGTTLESIPAQPYLKAEPDRVARWRAQIGPAGLKVGVAWQGSTAPYALPLQRSFPLKALEPLAGLAGVRLISLQKHNGLDQLATLPPGMEVETLGEDFDPGPDAFLDTAAAMTCCDLFITPDTSVAHLAGALGVRSWIALPQVADWRWLAGRDDSPWYPSTRLFRQAVRGDWGGVFAAMAAALTA